MNSDKVNYQMLKQEDLPYLEELLLDSELKLGLVCAETAVKRAERLILSNECNRIECDCTVLQEQIEYLREQEQEQELTVTDSIVNSTFDRMDNDGTCMQH